MKMFFHLFFDARLTTFHPKKHVKEEMKKKCIDVNEKMRKVKSVDRFKVAMHACGIDNERRSYRA